MEPTNEQNSRFKRLTNKKERYFRRLQDCYDLIKTLPVNLDQFQTRVTYLKELRDEFSVTLDDLAVLSDEHESFFTNTISLESTFDSLYYAILSNAVKHKVPHNSSVEGLNSIQPHRGANINLPEIKMDKYDGSPEKFNAFKSLYDNIIHNSPVLTDIEKFSYLISYLDKSALKLAQTVSFTPENYKVAYDLLVQRYTNKRLVANHYLSKIFSLTPLKSEAPQVINEFCECLQANIKALMDMNLSDLADYIFLYFALGLLDPKTRKEFENDYLEKEFPTFANFLSFLRKKCSISALIGTNNQSKTSTTPNISAFKPQERPYNINKRVSMVTQDVTAPLPNSAAFTTSNCPICGNGHKFIKCPNLLALAPKERCELVKTHQRCLACLAPHTLAFCRSKYRCQHCGSRRHNSLLHRNEIPLVKTGPQVLNTIPDTMPDTINTPSVTLVHSTANEEGVVALLATAQGHILSYDGTWLPCRAILDTGSHSNFITTSMADKLGLERKQCPHEIRGVGLSPLTKIQGLVDCKVTSIYDKNAYVNFQAIVIPKITADLPTVTLPPTVKKRFSSLQLADPNFHVPGPVDILLGVQSVLDLTPDEPSYLKGKPTAFITYLGWVIMGEVPHNVTPQSVALLTNISEGPSLNETLRSFWETEEIHSIPLLSPEDNSCEDYFKSTTERNHCGQYVVRLPFNEKISVPLSTNRDLAMNRFLQLEQRFKRDKQYHQLYSQNIKDYITQNHLVPATHISPYIMTHHGVIKESSSGTKMRVVFNPAVKDTNNISLNDTLLSGPKLHLDIGLVITRFRLPQIAVACDIKQMFRSILIHPEDRHNHHIFWRFTPNEPLTEWEHTRVIFGGTSSPFLALRVLKQLVEDEGYQYPCASQALCSSTYVDDIFSGADTVEAALALTTELTNLLKLGGFELGKWASSNPNVIPNSKNTVALPNSTPESTHSKVLGLCWDTKSDVLKCKVQYTCDPLTKRGVLSRIARTFDVNGYISPFTFLLKALMQQLWLLKLDWDDELPPPVLNKWLKLKSELHLLEDISIPRCVWKVGTVRAQLIGFSDASELGMAAVVYLRLEVDNDILINLLASKTRVAPLKTWTIPRLELGAACLLAKLIKSIEPAFQSLHLFDTVCFSDSLNTLSWIQTQPHRLKIFFANRVVQIHDYIPNAKWRYVPSGDNPADPASRGLLPSELISCSIWWKGPDFLHRDIVNWPQNKYHIATEEGSVREVIQYNLFSTVPEEQLFANTLRKLSSLVKLQRIIAYTLRIAYNWYCKIRPLAIVQWQVGPTTGPLTAQEYENALTIAIKITQSECLRDDILLLKKGRPCSKTYRQLTPFLSSSGLVMVGGRLSRSQLPDGAKHPFLIPKTSNLAALICDYYHHYSGHGGIRLVQSLVTRKFWIPSLRQLIRSRIFRCLTCYRFKVSPIQPPMAELPSYRLQPGRCFAHTGIDFAGPFMVKCNNLRSARYEKQYISLFICMVSRAVHIEVVTSLSTDACLASLDRFIARRGLPTQIYSDQGRNFRGASREITEITKFFDANDPHIAHYLSVRGIRWCFNPPYAPHFGGLWEAGVKSAKYHLKRILGQTKFTLEEFLTVTTRVEAILNSRPFCTLSVCADDGFDALTPGHFLIGAPLLSRLEVDLSTVPVNRLTRWQLCQQMVRHFWKRWSQEYLHSLQQKPKWTIAPKPTLSVGDVVLYFHPDSPPTHWPLARVIKLITGADNIVRVVHMKTPSGEVVRPINKGQSVNYSYSEITTAEEICEASTKLITFLDLAGHKKYIRTTIKGLSGYSPHHAMLVISSTVGAVGMSKEHLTIAVALNVPFFIVITKIDLAAPSKTLLSLDSFLKQVGSVRVPLIVETLDDVITAGANQLNQNVVPIFCVSNVTGEGLDLLQRFLYVLPPGISSTEREQLQQDLPEFQIDENFRVGDIGQVLGGLLSKGVITEGANLQIGPHHDGSFTQTVVRSIHRNRVPCHVVRAGQSAALCLNTSINDLRNGMVLLSTTENPRGSLYFQARISVLYHPSAIYEGFQATVHIGNIRQTVVLLGIFASTCIRTNEHDSVLFKFKKYPELVRIGQRLLFRNGTTKGIGEITQVFPYYPDNLEMNN